MNVFEMLPWIGNNMHPPVSYCHHFASVVRPSTITKKSSLLKLRGQLRPNFGGMVLGRFTSKIVSDSPDLQPTWPLLLKIKRGEVKLKKMFISVTTGPIGTKLCLYRLWMTPFKIVSGNADFQPTWPSLLKIDKGGGVKFEICFLWNYWANWIHALLR